MKSSGALRACRLRRTYLERLRLEQAERDTELADSRERLHQIELAIETSGQSNRERPPAARRARDASESNWTIDSQALEDRYGPSSEQLRLASETRKPVAEELARRKTRLRPTARADAGDVDVGGSRAGDRGTAVPSSSTASARLPRSRNFLQGVVTHCEKVYLRDSEAR